MISNGIFKSDPSSCEAGEADNTHPSLPSNRASYPDRIYQIYATCKTKEAIANLFRPA